MAKNRENSINLFGAVQARTEDGIVAHADGIAVEYDENGKPTKTLEQAIADGSLGGENCLEVIDVEELPSPTIDTSTAVPSSGQVGKVYYNTKLSVEEVNAILDTLEYTTNTDLFPLPFIAVAMDSTMQNGLMCTRVSYDGGVTYNYSILDVINGANGNGVYEWDTSYNEGLKGWINSETNFNIDNMLSVLAPQVGMTIQNDKLKQLISITPFEEPNPDIELDKLYRIPVKTQKGWLGTVVPNSGYVDKVYLNTELSIEDYYKILNNLTWLDSSSIGQSGFEFYPALLYMSNSAPYVVGFMKYSENNIHFGLLNYSTMETIQNFFTGEWITFKNPYPIGFEALSELSGIPIGTQNDLIKSMFSVTPFSKINEEVVGYKYHQLINGEWKEFGSGELPEDLPVIIESSTTLHTYEDLVITSEMFKQLWESDNAILKVAILTENNANGNITQFNTFIKTSTQMQNEIRVIVLLSNFSNNYTVLNIIEYNGMYGAEATTPAIVNDVNLEFKVTEGILNLSAKINNASGYDRGGVYVDTETATDSDNLITSRAVRNYIAEYVAEQLAKQSNEE